jgi:hypothetical protein
MKTKNQNLSLIVILLISSFSFAQKKNQASKLPPVNTEIQNMVKLIFDAPDLVKFYKDPKNLPVKILEYDEINKRNLENLKIYGQNVQIITLNDVNKNNISDYIDIVKWSEVLNMVDFELLHEKTKLRYKVLLLKKNGVLKLGTSEIIKKK